MSDLPDPERTLSTPDGQQPPLGDFKARFGPPSARGEVGTLGTYRLVKQLGKGGMGVVYAAIDTRLNRRLALKVMLPEFAADRDAKERFLREARAAAQITHDNVVIVHEADERDGVPYIAMQFLQGLPLDQYLKNKGTPPLAHAVRIGRETAAGLAAAHALGLVHRDIKPANLWLEAPNGRVKILDFGLVKPVVAEGGTELTSTGAVLGTPGYMSPEQARGLTVDARTDLFSLGAVLYRLCTGRNPFTGPNVMAVLMALGTEEPTPVRELNPSVPEALARLIHQLLAKKRELRPPTAAEVAKRLRAILDRMFAPSDAGAMAPSEGSASQPVVVNPVPVQPPIVAPMQVSAAPEDVFAHLEDDGLSAGDSASPAQKPERKTSGKGMPIVTAAAVLTAMIAATVIVVQMGTKASPDAKAPEAKAETVPPPKPKAELPKGADPDRKAAEWVLLRHGTVRINGHPEGHEIKDTTQLPKERFDLTAVGLKENRAVTDADLINLKGLSELTSLILTGTAVTSTGLAHLTDLPKLSRLDLDSTETNDDALRQLKALPNLVSVNLDATKVGDSGVVDFLERRPIKLLRLNNTKGYVSDAALAALKGKTSLQHLSVVGTGVTDAGLTCLEDCTALEALYVDHTGVTNAGLVHLKRVERLQTIGLQKTNVTDDGLASLKDCKGLTMLSVSETRVSDAGLAHFAGCNSFLWLFLNGTQVTDAGLAHLAGCKELAWLHLNNTPVTDAGVDHIKRFTRLSSLEVKGTKMTAKGIDELKAALPKCKIVWNGGVIEPKK